MKNNKLFILLLILFYSIQSNGQTVKLSYADFITNVMLNNPLSKRADNEKKYGELNYKAAKGNYDPFVSGVYDQKQFNGTNYFTTLSSEIKQPLFTSQYLKFGYEYGNGTYVNPELSTSQQGLPYVGLEVGVLQGLVIDKRRAEVLKSKEYLNYYDAEKQIQLNTLLFESSQRYFDWLYSAKQMALNNYFMEVARQRLKGIEALANIGEKAAIDTIEAAIFFQSRLLDLQSALIDYQKNTNDLSSFNWQDENGPNSSNKYEPTDSLDSYFNKIKTILTETLYQGEVSNPVISKYNSFQKVLQIENRLKKETIKPNLNVKYNFLSNNPSSANLAFSNNNYKWGLNLSFPLLLRNSVNEYKMSKIVLQNNGLELTNKKNELKFKIETLKQTISILAQQLQNAALNANYNKQLVEAEKLKFSNGESSLFMVNTRENKWLESELKLAEYKLKFIKTFLNVVYLNGNLNYKL